MELTPDIQLKITSVLAARPARARMSPPRGLRTEHSLLELPPVYDNEAAIEVIQLHTDSGNQCHISIK